MGVLATCTVFGRVFYLSFRCFFAFPPYIRFNRQWLLLHCRTAKSCILATTGACYDGGRSFWATFFYAGGAILLSPFLVVCLNVPSPVFSACRHCRCTAGAQFLVLRSYLSFCCFFSCPRCIAFSCQSLLLHCRAVKLYWYYLTTVHCTRAI